MFSYLFSGFFILYKEIFSIFWILFSGFILSCFSIYRASINWICNGSFWDGIISIVSTDSIEFSSLDILDIANLSTFWTIFSGLIKSVFSINKISTICFFSGSFSIGRISKLSLASVIVLSSVKIVG